MNVLPRNRCRPTRLFRKICFPVVRALLVAQKSSSKCWSATTPCPEEKDDGHKIIPHRDGKNQGRRPITVSEFGEVNEFTNVRSQRSKTTGTGVEDGHDVVSSSDGNNREKIIELLDYLTLSSNSIIEKKSNDMNNTNIYTN